MPLNLFLFDLLKSFEVKMHSWKRKFLLNKKSEFAGYFTESILYSSLKEMEGNFKAVAKGEK